jgi:hypothetical protein
MPKQKYVFELRSRKATKTNLTMRFVNKGTTHALLVDNRVKTGNHMPEDISKNYDFFKPDQFYRVQFECDLSEKSNPQTQQLMMYLNHPLISTRFDSLVENDFPKPNPQFDLVDVGNMVKEKAERLSRIIDIGYRLKSMGREEWRDIAFQYAPGNKSIINMDDDEVFVFLADPETGVCMKDADVFEKLLVEPMREMKILVGKAIASDLIVKNTRGEFVYGAVTCGPQLDDIYNYLRANPKIYENLKINVARNSKSLPLTEVDYEKTPVDLLKKTAEEVISTFTPNFQKEDYDIEDYRRIAKKLNMRGTHNYSDKENLKNNIILHCQKHGIKDVPGPEEAKKTLEELQDIATEYGISGVKAIKDADKLFKMIIEHCRVEGITPVPER